MSLMSSPKSEILFATSITSRNILAMARTESHPLRLGTVDRAAAGRCVLHSQPPAERATRVQETGFVELHFDLSDYDRVLGLLSRQRPVWVSEDLGLEG